MTDLELIVFNVGHGLSVALIERPENYVSLIDLGSDTGFTPLKYLALNRQLRPDILYITHPHADHISDVETALDRRFRPDAIHYQDYDWSDVASREKPECRKYVRLFQQLIAEVPSGNYSGGAELTAWRYTPETARKEFGDSRYVNASSLFVIYKWRDFKIAVASDHETDVFEGFLATKGFAAAAKSSDILIAPHHGHKNGFSGKWVSTVGKPYVTLISAQERDEHVDARYCSPDFARSVSLESERRYTITTRCDGNISVNMYYNGDKPNWVFKAF